MEECPANAFAAVRLRKIQEFRLRQLNTNATDNPANHNYGTQTNKVGHGSHLNIPTPMHYKHM